MTDQQEQKLSDVLKHARQRSSDRAIIRTMRVTVWGIGALAVFFVAYIVALVIAGQHDAERNRRIDDIEHRVQKLEAWEKAP